MTKSESFPYCALRFRSGVEECIWTNGNVYII